MKVTLRNGQNISYRIQTLKRFRITLFIRTKHNMRVFGVIPFTKLQNDTKQQLNGKKNDEK